MAPLWLVQLPLPAQVPAAPQFVPQLGRAPLGDFVQVVSGPPSGRLPLGSGARPRTVSLAEEISRSDAGSAAAGDNQDNSSSGCSSSVTTLMIRNIPNRCSQRQLINDLNSLGLKGTFDFLHVPLDLATMSNAGYAFVNFVDRSWAERCGEKLTGYKFKRQSKPAAVSDAHIQGLELNLRHCDRSAAASAAGGQQRRPVVMPGGVSRKGQRLGGASSARGGGG